MVHVLQGCFDSLLDWVTRNAQIIIIVGASIAALQVNLMRPRTTQRNHPLNYPGISSNLVRPNFATQSCMHGEGVSDSRVDDFLQKGFLHNSY